MWRGRRVIYTSLACMYIHICIYQQTIIILHYKYISTARPYAGAGAGAGADTDTGADSPAPAAYDVHASETRTYSRSFIHLWPLSFFLSPLYFFRLCARWCVRVFIHASLAFLNRVTRFDCNAMRCNRLGSTIISSLSFSPLFNPFSTHINTFAQTFQVSRFFFQ